ncbi:hypothetical protein [Streptococcus mitis]|uniref:hypothetical protein n=1 Tax=Streptococcus mitis TaxID=28037 RepID=UPI002001CC73|nr:hypothetical protein [Streptococcus mitis]
MTSPILFMMQRAFKSDRKIENDDGFDEAKEIYLFSKLLARVRIQDIKDEEGNEKIGD